MPIDPEFPKNHQVICKHKHADGEHFHFVCGPGRTAEAAENEEVKKSSEARGKQIVLLGVHGAMVVVDWDSCYANRACIEACPVQVYQWYRTEQYVSAIEMQNATSEDSSENSLRDGSKDDIDKSDPIREDDFIWWMACVSAYPRQAVKVDQANLEFHEKATGTFNENLANSGSLPPLRVSRILTVIGFEKGV